MTRAEHDLIDAAKATLDYLERKIQGQPLKGQYEDIGVARMLASAIVRAEREDAA